MGWGILVLLFSLLHFSVLLELFIMNEVVLFIYYKTVNAADDVFHHC